MRLHTILLVSLLLMLSVPLVSEGSDAVETVFPESMEYSEGSFSVTMAEPIPYVWYQCSIVGPDGEPVFGPASWNIGGANFTLLCSEGAVIGNGTYVLEMDSPVCKVSGTAVLSDMVESVLLERTSLTLAVGETRVLGCTVQPSDAFEPKVHWSSADTGVVSVSPAGEITAVSEGRTAVRAYTSNGVVSACEVAVVGSAVTGVVLDRSHMELTVGESDVLTAETLPEDLGPGMLVWTSDDTSVVTADGGRITAAGAGTATVTVTVWGTDISASCSVTVSDAPVPPDPPQPGKPIPESLRVTGEPVSEYDVGEGFDFGDMKVIAVYSDGSEADVTSRCSVSPETFTAAGDVEVVLTYGGLSVKVEVSVMQTGPFEQTVEVSGGVLDGQAYDYLLYGLKHTSDKDPKVTLESSGTDSVRFPCGLAPYLGSPGSELRLVLAEGVIVLPGEVLSSLDGKETEAAIRDISDSRTVNGTAYDVSVSVDGRSLGQLVSPVSVSLYFEVPSGNTVSDLELTRVDGDGSRHAVEEWEQDEGTVTFETQVLSVFVLGFPEPQVPEEPAEETSGSHTLVYAAVAVLMIIIVAAAAFKHSR